MTEVAQNFLPTMDLQAGMAMSETTVELPEYAITDPQRIGEVLNVLENHPYYGFDVETTSLDWTRGQIHGISVATQNQEENWYVFGNATEPFIQGLVDLHRHHPNKGVIGHNLKFDLHFMSKYGYRPRKIADTMMAQRLVDENLERGLKALAYTRLGIENLPEYHDLIKEASVSYTCGTKKCVDFEKTKYKEPGTCPFCSKKLKSVRRLLAEMTIFDIPTGKLVEYAARDTRLTLDLWNVLKEDLRREGYYKHFFEYDMPYLYVLHDMEEAGVYVDQNVVTAMDAEIREGLRETHQKWQELTNGINYNSTLELPVYLYDTLKLPVSRMTKTGKRSTDALSLQRLKDDDKTGAVATLLKIRELEKLLGTYVEVLQRKPNLDGRIRTNFNQDGAVTGRLSSDTPNLQNIPSRSDLGKRIREAFAAQSEDTVMLVADYSQLELRLVAHFSQEPKMVDAFLNGDDLHQVTADMMGVARAIGKTLNFGCVTMDSTALTPEGWKGYDSLDVGSVVMGYNPQSGQLEWTKVVDIAKYENAPIVRMQVGKGFDVRVTPNHRWFAQRRRHLGDGSRPYVGEFVETWDLTSEHRLVLSAVADTPTILDITPNEAAIIGWLHTDGHTKRGEYVGAPAQAGGKKVAFEGRILQKKEGGRQHIEEILKSVGHYTYVDKKTGVVHYMINPAYLRDLWERAHLDQLGLEGFVAMLDPDQRRAFMVAVYLAEGFTKGEIWERGGMRMAQNEGDELDALRLGAFLEGYYVRQYDRQQYTGNNNAHLALTKPHVTCQEMRVTEDGHEDVWCIKTEFGTWVMRQGNQIMVTGNTVYGQGPRTMCDTIEESGKPRPKETEAKEWLKKYDQTYPILKRWKWAQVDYAREHGFVTTILGRKRRLPDINSFDNSLRSRAERQSYNAPIQGSAADIIQIAQLDIAEVQAWYGARMLLQVHDELVFEVPRAAVEDFKPIVQEKMEGVGERLGMTVKLVAEPGTGNSWLSAKG
jgi:DNA polymerase I-like protein with 3'-5' exonuclease and polymerase domains